MYNNNNTKFSVDWLNVRLDGLLNPDEFINQFMETFDLSLNDVIRRPSGGVCYFDKCYYVPDCGYSSILFAYNEDEEGNFLSEGGYGKPFGLMISVSGDGCRWLEHRIHNGMLAFCELICKYPYHVTRIDMAADFLDKNNTVVPMIQLWAQLYYQGTSGIGLSCNLRQENLVHIDLVNDKLVGDYTPNITVGKRDSKKGTMQLYNKRVEMERGRLSDIKQQMFDEYGVTDYWYRLEYRCKSYAPKVFEALIKQGVQAAYLAACEGFGRFYAYSDVYDSSRSATVEEWNELLSWIRENIIHFV